MNRVSHNTQRKLFIGGLPRQYTEDTLREIFGKYGEINQVHIHHNQHEYAATKCCAFVTYAEPEAATKALECLNEQEVNGHFLKIQHAENITVKREGSQSEVLERYDEVDHIAEAIDKDEVAPTLSIRVRKDLKENKLNPKEFARRFKSRRQAQ